MLTCATLVRGNTGLREAGMPDSDRRRNPVIAAAASLAAESEAWQASYAARADGAAGSVQFIVSPPLDIASFMKLLRKTKETFDCTVVQITGSYRDGCIVTMNLPDREVRDSVSATLMGFSRTLGLEMFIDEDI